MLSFCFAPHESRRMRLLVGGAPSAISRHEARELANERALGLRLRSLALRRRERSSSGHCLRSSMALREKDFGAFDGDGWLLRSPGADGSVREECRGSCSQALRAFLDGLRAL